MEDVGFQIRAIDVDINTSRGDLLGSFERILWERLMLACMVFKFTSR